MANIPIPEGGAPVVFRPEPPDTKNSLKLCQDCLYYERSIESQPCRTCLPKAREVPGWEPRT